MSGLAASVWFEGCLQQCYDMKQQFDADHQRPGAWLGSTARDCGGDGSGSGSDVCIAEYIQVSHYLVLVAC